MKTVSLLFFVIVGLFVGQLLISSDDSLEEIKRNAAWQDRVKQLRLVWGTREQTPLAQGTGLAEQARRKQVELADAALLKEVLREVRANRIKDKQERERGDKKYAAKIVEAEQAVLACMIHTGCDGVVLFFESILPNLHNKLLNRRDLAFLTSSAIATMVLHYNGRNNSHNEIPRKIALNACGKYVGIKAVDLIVSGINGFINWWLGRDMINPDSKKTKRAQSVVGTLTVILLHQMTGKKHNSN